VKQNIFKVKSFILGCKELLCTDFCERENNLIKNPNCLKECNNESTENNEVYSDIMKKYNLYFAKYNLLKKNDSTDNTLEPDSFDKEIILQNIEKLKSQLYDEEKKLLNVYNLKKSEN
jgi:hypothetical protein